ncbi:MAG: tRNA uridine-5-carboxymethylaminomethyl(34) synthesis enzyme MnmG [Fibrobacteria bacterium]|nr:tRNA uridine-5-carboxymethylaminomethyl(34) synthesis enzyme MnmG [Fibrobacteria bacterium]
MLVVSEIFDVVVIGAGHAGIEASHASAKLGMKTALVCFDLDSIGRMSCNPAIGGVAKGQLVRDIDAIGGLMGRIADKSGIQFRMLNLSKGPAVWGPRAQMDMALYAATAKQTLESIENLFLLEAELLDFKRKENGNFSLLFDKDFRVETRALIVATGTFLDGKLYTGTDTKTGGRVGERASRELSHNIKKYGLRIRRLKTGTPARIARDSVEFSKCIVQPGDTLPNKFSAQTEFTLRNDAVCWITHTNKTTHDILKKGFENSPLFTGKITGIGPRYCPSIETKIDRFPDRDAHQLFLEPEGITSNRIYVNGFSSSLDEDIQKQALQTIPGLENCKILQIGYAVEYDAIDATQLHPSYECKDIPGLYFAGQVNGTSGYEEAAAQGLVAGINASFKILGKEPFILARSESYIGVLTDDLVSMDIDEPYRMFTSRAEYRLFLRQDNAEYRLCKKGHDIGLLSNDSWKCFLKSEQKIKNFQHLLTKTKITPKQVNSILLSQGKNPLTESIKAIQLLKRPEFNLDVILKLVQTSPDLSRQEKQFIESEAIYEGFVERQSREISRCKKLSQLRIPDNFDYDKASALSIEAREKLQKYRPMTVNLAAKISGVSPADISGLIYYINKG